MLINDNRLLTVVCKSQSYSKRFILYAIVTSSMNTDERRRQNLDQLMSKVNIMMWVSLAFIVEQLFTLQHLIIVWDIQWYQVVFLDTVIHIILFLVKLFKIGFQMYAHRTWLFFFLRLFRCLSVFFVVLFVYSLYSSSISLMPNIL